MTRIINIVGSIQPVIHIVGTLAPSVINIVGTLKQKEHTSCISTH